MENVPRNYLEIFYARISRLFQNQPFSILILCLFNYYYFDLMMTCTTRVHNITSSVSVQNLEGLMILLLHAKRSSSFNY